MNRKNAKILLIGGDLRQLTAADELKRLGYTVSVCGFGTYAGAEYKDGIHLPDGTDAVLLPVPVFRGEYMNLPFSEERVTGATFRDTARAYKAGLRRHDPGGAFRGA